MKFRSRKDMLSTTSIIGMCLFLAIITIIGILEGEMEPGERWVLIPILGSIGLLLWLFFDTRYELNQTYFTYKSGPFRGKIKTEQIREIVKGKTLWVGMKPATAQKGLIIKYNKFDEIYISPKTNDRFIEKILELNSKIKITT